MDDEYPNIAICSYNLNWEIMDINAGKLTKHYSVKELEMAKSNVLSNIQSIYDYYNPQIYCFQEAANYSEYTNIFNSEIFNHCVNKSGLEHMLTVWDSTRFELLDKKPGEFESGRPFCIFIFKDILVQNVFVLINLHAGHIPNTSSSIFKPIQKIFTKSKIFENYIITRIIMAGDFNRDINQQIKNDSNLSFELNHSMFDFKYYTGKMLNTCCSLSGNNLKKNFDFVIDTYDSCILRHELNKESWYKQPASDHIMIMSIIKQFEN